MANDGRQINVQITGQDDLSPVLRKTGAQVEDFGVQAGTVGHVLERIETAAVVAALFEIGRHALETGSHLAELAAQTGLSVEKLSALQYAATVSGSSSEVLEQGLRKLATTLSLSGSGSVKQSDALNALGVRAKDARGQMVPLDQALAQIADRFQRMPDGANKSALAVQIFGRSGAQLIPLLDQGSAGIDKLTEKARALGIVLSTEDAQALRAFNETASTLKLTVEGLAQQFIVGLAPGLERAAQALTEGLSPGMSLARSIGEDFGKFIDLLVLGFYSLATLVELVVRKIELLGSALELIAHGSFRDALEVMKQVLGLSEDAVSEELAAKLGLMQQKLFPDSEAAGGSKAQNDGTDVQRRNREDEAIAKEKLRLEEENQKLAAEFSKQIDALELANTKELYDKQLITAQQYYDKTKKLKEDELQAALYAANAEADAIKKALDHPADEKTRLALQIQYAAATERATVAQAQLNAIQAKTADGQIDKLKQQAQAMDRNAFLAQDMGKKIAEVYAALATAEQALAFQVATHQISQMQADQQANLLRDRAREKLQGMTADYKAFAQASGDPKLVQDANDLNLKLTELSHTLNTVRDAAFNAFENGFSTLFTDILTQSKSAGQAFLDFAKSIVAALDQVIAKMIAVWLFGKIIGMFAGSAPASGGAIGDAGTINPPLGGLGGDLPTVASASFAGAPAASSTLFVPSSLGSVAASSASFAPSAAAPMFVYNIDARGAAPGVDQAIVRALAMTKDQSVREAVAKVRDIQLRR